MKINYRYIKTEAEHLFTSFFKLLPFIFIIIFAHIVRKNARQTMEQEIRLIYTLSTLAGPLRTGCFPTYTHKSHKSHPRAVSSATRTEEGDSVLLFKCYSHLDFGWTKLIQKFAVSLQGFAGKGMFNAFIFEMKSHETTDPITRGYVWILHICKSMLKLYLHVYG